MCSNIILLKYILSCICPSCSFTKCNFRAIPFEILRCVEWQWKGKAWGKGRGKNKTWGTVSEKCMKKKRRKYGRGSAKVPPLRISNGIVFYVCSSCPAHQWCDSNWAQWQDGPNPNVLYGALVGGKWKPVSPKGSDWIRLVFAHPFPLNNRAPVASTSFQLARFKYLHMGLLHHTHSLWSLPN